LSTFLKIHFTHFQQCDKNHCVYLARIGRRNDKAGGNVTTHAQHRIVGSAQLTQVANCSTMSPAYYVLLLIVECAVIGLCKNTAVLPRVP